MSNSFSTSLDLLISSLQNQLKWQRQENLTISIEKQHKRTIELNQFQPDPAGDDRDIKG